jgi:hypothetical protein
MDTPVFEEIYPRRRDGYAVNKNLPLFDIKGMVAPSKDQACLNQPAEIVDSMIRESTNLSTNRVISLSIRDIIIDVTVLQAVKSYIKYHVEEFVNFNPYWDEDLNFIVKDDGLLPLTRLDILALEDTVNLPLIKLERNNKGFYYVNGRHRHARLLLLFLKNKIQLDTNLLNKYVLLEVFTTEGKKYEEDNKEFLFKSKTKEILDSGLKYFIFDGNRRVFLRVSRKEFSESKHAIISYRKLVVKFSNCERNVAKNWIVQLYQKLLWSGESIISSVKEMYNSLFHKITDSINVVKNMLEIINDPIFVPLFLDVVAMLNSLNSPYPCFDSIVVKLLRLYSIYLRGQQLFTTESIEEALLMSTILPLLPDCLTNVIKRMQLFTSKKILDTPGVILEFVADLGTFIMYILEQLPTPDCIIVMVKKIFSVGTRFRYSTLMNKLVVAWKTNKKIIMDVPFHEEVVKTWNAIELELDVKSYLMSQKKTIWEDFARLYKAVISYKSVSRQEPFCLVFEGPPGTKKSHILNKYIQYQKEPSYVHVVKASADGKDFYDGYNNEKYFLMDDVGQMGISQWRTIINMVSTVKLPLDCAEAGLKDTKYFNSEVILVTTNRFMHLNGLTKTDCIDNLDALWRRGHVLDFSQVRRDGGNLKGIISYKRRDLEIGAWVDAFIPHVMPDDFPTYIDASNENKVIAWIGMIIKKHGEFYANVQSSVHVSDSQRVIIDEYISEYENSFFDAQGFLTWGFDVLIELKDVILYTFSEMISSVCEFIKNIDFKTLAMKSVRNSYLLIMLVSFVVVISLYSAISWLCGDVKNMPEDNKSLTNIWKDSMNVAMRCESAEVNSTTVIDAVQNRLIVVEIHKDDGTTEFMQAFTSGLCLLIPYHATVKGVVSISGYLNFDQVENRVKCIDHITVQVVYENKLADVCILKLPTYFATPFKYSGKLLSKNAIHKHGNVNYQIRQKHTYFVNSYASIPVNRMWINHQGSIEYFTDNYKNILTPNDYCTYALSQPGLCGSLIVDQDVGILGMHVAGNGITGVSVVFDNKVLKSILETFTAYQTSFVNIPDIRTEKMDNMKEFSGIVYDKSYFIQVPKSTNFVKSPLLEFCTNSIDLDLKVPVVLNANGPGTIHDVAMKSFQLVSGYKKEEIDFVKDVFNILIPEYTDISDYNVIKGNDFLPKFNMKSVNGIGYDRKKDLYIDIESGQPTELFKNKLLQFEEDVKNKKINIDDLMLYETLKDELRSQDKAEKPRSFRISPLHLVYLMKKLFGDLAGQIIEDKWNNGIAIGINPYKDWNRLYEELKSKKVFDGDVGQYDGKQPAELQDALSDVLKRKYKGKHYALMELMAEYLVRVMVAIMNRVVQTTHSVSSGYWMTSLGNSLLNRGHTAVCYYRECIKLHKKPTVTEFMKISDFVFGDDKLVGVPKGLEFINGLTMKNYFNSVGMSFTDANKREMQNEFCNIWEVSFLKRTFSFNKKLQKVMCPLDLKSIYSSLCYYDKTKDYEVVMKGKIESAQRELWLHSIDCSELLQYCRKENLFFLTLNEEYMRQLYTSDVDMAWKLFLIDTGKLDPVDI